MPFCSNCGKKINDRAKFCDGCGCKVPEQEEDKNVCICVKCGSFLNNQKGFHPQKEMHKCTICGEKNYGDDIYSGDKFKDTYWYCDKCNALLNKQKGFDDRLNIWPCSECGYKNVISEDNIINSEDEKKSFKKEKNNTNERKILYDGEIHKCPSCGKVLNSLVAICPNCGFEIRNSKCSYAIEEFSKKINSYTNTNQIVNLIRTFPVPNNKEDLYEFMLIAKTNLKNYDQNGDGILSEIEKETISAWQTKFEQCYDKAKVLFSNLSDFELFERTKKEISLILDEIKFETKSDILKRDFKKAKIAKIASIIGMIFSPLWLLLAIANEKIGALLIGILMVLCFISVFLIGNQTIKLRIKKLYILPLVIGHILFVPYIIATNTETIDFDSLILGEYLPELGTNKGYVDTNLDELLVINDVKFSEKDYVDYIEKCKNFGYTIDVDQDTSVFEAYNSEGYFIKLTHYSFSSGTDIELTAPMKMTNIKWPSSDIASMIPVPNSLYGKISWQNSDGFAIYIGNMNLESFNEYVELLLASGFTVDYRRGETYFYADNSEGYYVKVTYEGFNKIFIICRSPN